MSELIPPNWTPQERALAAQADRITAVPVVVREVWNPWTCPTGILPWLGWALHVDDWAACRTEHQQRAAIAESIAIHRIKGTASAVRKALQAVGYDVQIDENTGVAYTFRVILDISKGGFDEEDFTRTTDVVMENKNVRSHLLGVTTLLSGTDTLYATVAHVAGEKTAILPPLAKLWRTAKALFIASAAQAIEYVTIRPPALKNPTLSGQLYCAGVIEVELIYG